MTSGIHCETDENCLILGYYTTRSGNSIPKFRDTLSVPASRVKNPRTIPLLLAFLTLEEGGCPQTSVRNYHSTPRKSPEEHISHLPPGGNINPLNPELNPICYLLALLGAHNFLYVSRIRVKLLTFRRLMSYIYMEHPFLMFLDHTQRRSTVGRTPLDE